MSTEPVRRAQGGFSLIELMVALVLAALGIIVIYQVVSLAESRKRSVVAGGDAQVQGNLGMLGLERELASAGWGLAGLSAGSFGCPLPVGSASVPLFPIWATDGGVDGAGLPRPDTLTVITGNSPLMSSVANYTATSGGTTTVTRSIAGFRYTAGGTIDTVLFADGLATAGHCLLTPLTGVSTAGTGSITTVDLATTLLATAGQVANLGNLPRVVRWSIADSGQLVYQQLAGPAADALPVPAADGIVNLQIQFGFDANRNGQIDEATEWFDPGDPRFLPASQPSTYSYVMAVRIALLARSGQYEKGGVYLPAGQNPGSGASPSDPRTLTEAQRPVMPWTGTAFHIGTPASVSAAEVSASQAGGADPVSDWRNYRYRVYASGVVPLNLVWR
jgi:type IV pilus assembly protein PilW